MKKLFCFSLMILVLVLGIIFHEDIANQLKGNEKVQQFAAKITGISSADTSVEAFGDSYYAYSTLNDEQKLLYNQIADCLLHFKEEVTLSTQTEADVDTAFECLLSDHSEIFWCSAYELSMYQVAGLNSEYVFKPTYQMTEEEVRINQQAIDAYVAECLAGLDQNADDYGKAKYLFDYIVLHTDYNTQAQNNQNICSVFLDRQSVCMGYSKAFSYLLAKAGIQSCVVSGQSEQQSHAWNLVRLDGTYCYIDVTWGDPAFSGESVPVSDYIDYTFFGITTDNLLKTHSIDNAFALPDCTSQQNNYFVREGLYLTSFDKSAIGTMLTEHLEKDGCVTICASDLAVYQQLYHYLIDESEIASYVNSSKVSYIPNDTNCTLTVFSS